MEKQLFYKDGTPLVGYTMNDEGQIIKRSGLFTRLVKSYKIGNDDYVKISKKNMKIEHLKEWIREYEGEC